MSNVGKTIPASMRGATISGLRPGDAGYDAVRTVWNAMVDRGPALIARCGTVPEVIAAVRYGREQGLEIGVRGDGHSVLGLPVSDGGLLIDLASMDRVRVDPGSRRAKVGGGALLGALDATAQRYGLASRTERSDLLWGLRGGGRNFGVVTEFEFRLHPIGTWALRVDLVHEFEDASTALRGWRDLLAEAPRRAIPVARVTQRDGRPVVIGYVWVGDPADGRQRLGAYRSIGWPVAERVEELSYLDLQTDGDDVERHAVRRYWKGHYLRQLTDQAIEAFLDRGNGAYPAARLTLNGGAISDVSDEDSPTATAMRRSSSPQRWSGRILRRTRHT